METISFASPMSIVSQSIVKLASNSSCYNNRIVFLRRSYNRNTAVYCQSGNQVSAVLPEISSPATTSTQGDGNLESGKDNEGIGIVKFITGKSILITGATGFLGKVLVEKILRVAPDVGKLFILIKAKDKEAAMWRLENELINAELFKRLEQIHGKSYYSFVMSKLVPVVGNICESDLGLDEDAAHLMASEVDIIINSAANTTFDERYDKALEINTIGPMNVMNYARSCKKLGLFLQVSTAYANGLRKGRVMEKPFFMGESIAHQENQDAKVPLFNVEEEMQLVELSKQFFDSDEAAHGIMKKVGKDRANKFGWQDPYTFTKAMGEMIVEQLRGDIPLVIVRPSVIESTFRDPFPGWIQGNRMMDPFVTQFGKGQLKGFLGDPSGVLDVIPVDMVVNAILAAVATHGVHGKQENNVYQIASSVTNPLTLQNLNTFSVDHFTASPYVDSAGNPIHVQEFKFFNSLDDLSFNLWKYGIELTGLLASATGLDDRVLKRLELIYRKTSAQAKQLIDVYEPYIFYAGRFDCSNVKRLEGLMSEEERKQFGVDVENIDWKDYISNIHIPGLRRYVMREKNENRQN